MPIPNCCGTFGYHLTSLPVVYPESKPAEWPTTFEEREKRLQKEYSCVENLNQERISPSDTSVLLKTRRITPATEASSASVARTSRLFQCPLCSYWSKKKANLTRHISLHSLSSPAPPQARYCAKCDVQFSLYRNYQYKTCSRFIDPASTQQVQHQQPQNQQHHPIALPNEPRSSGSINTTTAVTSESESRDFINTSSSPVTSESGFNMVLNQPLYTAPGTGLTPAGNMIPPNPSTPPESNSDSQGGNVISNLHGDA
ncbi:hypothetical protein CDAR_58781 [Caerostris darwini]|uniref:C2H2-type domain-containing protein n=1 Tax=Caerostris darwini TaxID=1538125 RepID=A0AAV4S2K7_9ARAC|nr:hypothetical protein CDAR_58781 [Caerostris darwini]